MDWKVKPPRIINVVNSRAMYTWVFGVLTILQSITFVIFNCVLQLKKSLHGNQPSFKSVIDKAQKELDLFDSITVQQRQILVEDSELYLPLNFTNYTSNVSEYNNFNTIPHYGGLKSHNQSLVTSISIKWINLKSSRIVRVILQRLTSSSYIPLLIVFIFLIYFTVAHYTILIPLGSKILVYSHAHNFVHSTKNVTLNTSSTRREYHAIYLSWHQKWYFILGGIVESLYSHLRDITHSALTSAGFITSIIILSFVTATHYYRTSKSRNYQLSNIIKLILFCSLLIMITIPDTVGNQIYLERRSDSSRVTLYQYYRKFRPPDRDRPCRYKFRDDVETSALMADYVIVGRPVQRYHRTHTPLYNILVNVTRVLKRTPNSIYPVRAGRLVRVGQFSRYPDLGRCWINVKKNRHYIFFVKRPDWSGFCKISQLPVVLTDENYQKATTALRLGPHPLEIRPLYHADVIEMNEGNDLVLSCEVMGRPTPLISWFVNRIEIQNPWKVGTRIGIEQKTTSHSQLHIGNLHMTDTANYSCVAENLNGHIRKSVQVIVRQITTLPPPTTSTTPTDFTVQSTTAHPCHNYCYRGHCYIVDGKPYCSCISQYRGTRCTIYTPGATDLESDQVNELERKSSRCESGCESNLSRTLLFSAIGALLLMLVLFIICVILQTCYKKRRSTQIHSVTSGRACSAKNSRNTNKKGQPSLGKLSRSHCKDFQLMPCIFGKTTPLEQSMTSNQTRHDKIRSLDLDFSKSPELYSQFSIAPTLYFATTTTMATTAAATTTTFTSNTSTSTRNTKFNCPMTESYRKRTPNLSSGNRVSMERNLSVPSLVEFFSTSSPTSSSISLNGQPNSILTSHAVQTRHHYHHYHHHHQLGTNTLDQQCPNPISFSPSNQFYLTPQETNIYVTDKTDYINIRPSPTLDPNSQLIPSFGYGCTNPRPRTSEHLVEVPNFTYDNHPRDWNNQFTILNPSLMLDDQHSHGQLCTNDLGLQFPNSLTVNHKPTSSTNTTQSRTDIPSTLTSRPNYVTMDKSSTPNYLDYPNLSLE